MSTRVSRSRSTLAGVAAVLLALGGLPASAGPGANLAPPAATALRERADGTDGSTVWLDGEMVSGNVTVIVQLEPGNVGIPFYRRLLGTSDEQRHDAVKDRIEDLVEQLPDELPMEDEPSPMLTEPDANSTDKQGDTAADATDRPAGNPDEAETATYTPQYEEVADFYRVLDGFAVTVPAAIVEDLPQVEGVKSIALDRVQQLPPDMRDGTDGTPLLNQSSLEMTGVDGVTERGDGQTIMIIDSGLDTSHEAFTGDLDDDKLAVTQVEMEKLRDELPTGKSAAYVSEKIPFAYDYADGDNDVVTRTGTDNSHGTHVAGIAGANAGSIRGTAPNSQLFIAKVARDYDGGIADSSLLAALDDAVVLHPDVINMSLGTDGGMSSPEGTIFAQAYQTIEAEGITLNVAAGNAYSAAYQNASGRNLPYVTDPDSSTVSAPSTYSQAVSVASIDNARGLPYITVAGQQIGYVQGSHAANGSVAQFADVPDGEYPIVDGGIGSSADTDRLFTEYPDGLGGSMVLVQRGGDDNGTRLTFEQKMANIALPFSPMAVVFYDDEDALRPPNIAYENTSTPAIAISKADGEAVRASGGPIVVKQGEYLPASTEYAVSDFSSWGVAPDLKLKPEIAAPGGMIYSSLPGGTYGEMSGTSMATPQVSGISALVKEHVESNALYEGLSEREQTEAVTNLLLSTAVPLRDGDSYVSPRHQGAGIVNVPAATSSSVLVAVEGGGDSAHPKAELGDGTSGWSFTLELTNLADSPAAYALDAAALSERIEDGLFQQHSEDWTGRGVSVSFSGDVTESGPADGNNDGRVTGGSDFGVTVPARGSARVTVTVTPEAEFASFAQNNTPNGTFIDGFIFLKGEAGAADLSVPFLGFYGDWSAAPVFDANLWSGEAHIYGTALANRNTGSPLGLNPLDPNVINGVFNASDIQPDRFVVSNQAWSAAPSAMQPVTGTLRTVSNLTYEYTNEAGEVVRRYSYGGVRKSLYNPTVGTVLYAEATVGAPVFDGRDDGGRNLPEGKYTLTQKATVAGTEEVQSQSFDFYYDLTGPQIGELVREDVEGDTVLSFTVTDNSWLSAIDFHDPSSGGWFYREFAGEPSYADGVYTYNFTVRVSDLQRAWTDMGGSGDVPDTVPLYAWDYGLNSSRPLNATIRPIPMTALAVEPSDMTLAPGQSARVSASYEPAEANETELQWTSSDESIATVAGDGTVTAHGVGQAMITATSVYAPEVSASATLTVAEVDAEQGILLSTDELTLPSGGSGTLTALLAPEFADAEVAWQTSDSDLVEVEAEGVIARLTAADTSGEATITASFSRDGREYAASAAVKVRQPDYDDYVIDADGRLEYYRGSSTSARVPGNVKIIGAEAFAGASMQRVTIPAGVVEIEDRAFAGAPNLVELIFEDSDENPSQLTTIGSDIIYNTLRFQRTDLPRSVRTVKSGAFRNSTIQHISLPGGLIEIPDNMFAYDAQLGDVTVSDDVTTIGASAFAGTPIGELKLVDATGASVGSGLPAKLTAIGDSAFSGTALTSAVLPSGVRSLGGGAFAQAQQLTEVTLNDGLASIGQQAFAGTGVSSLGVPDSVTSVGRGAFAYMGALRTIHLGAGIGEEQLIAGFTGDGSLAEVTVSEESDAYIVTDGVLFTKDMTQLIVFPRARAQGATEYTVPDGVQGIAEEAFYQASVSQVSFPESLRMIGRYAFINTELTEIVLPDEFETLETHAFQGVGTLQSVDLGGTVTVGSYAFDSDTSLSSVNMRPELGRLTTIQAGAFATAPIRELIMPDSLTEIGGGAFINNSQLVTVHIGAGVTAMDSAVFTGSNNLRNLTVSEDNPVYSAEQNVLYAAQSDGLHLVLSLPTNTFTYYRVKDGTVQIDQQAFRNNGSLQRVYLPDGLKTISVGAFNNTSALEEVRFPDSLESVDGFYMNSSLHTVDFGTRISSINENAFMGKMPERIVVRGGQDAVVRDSMDFEDTDQVSAYYGEGVASVGYSYGTFPQILVLPSSLTELSLATYSLTSVADRVVYVDADEGSQAWNVASEALANAGLDPTTQLRRYVPLSAQLGVVDLPDGGEPGLVEVTITGGVLEGAHQARVVTVDAEGTASGLTEWMDAQEIDGGYAASLTFDVPADSTEVRVEIRDHTYMTRRYQLDGTLEVPEPTPQPEPTDEPTPQPEPTDEPTGGPTAAPVIPSKANAFVVDGTEILFGRSSDVPLMGDWDGDGLATPGVKRGNTYYLVNSLRGGQADVVFHYGKAADEPLVGDFNGDGRDTVAVKRGNAYFVRDTLTGGPADLAFYYGRASDRPLAGDFDGDGRDTISVRRGAVLYVNNELTGGVPTMTLHFGRASDVPLAGRWDSDQQADTLALIRGGVLYVNTTPEGTGATERTVEVGNANHYLVGGAPGRPDTVVLHG